jgi:hypothetical protein
MKRLLTTVLVATLLICGAAAALLITRPAAAADAEDPAVKADHAVVAALEKGDFSAADKLLDADFSWIDSEGIMWAKEDAVRAKLKPLVGTDSDVKMVEHKYGKVIWIQISKGNNYSAHFWVERPSGWKLLHMTEITARQRDFAPVRATFDIPCQNPCKAVPYKPLTTGEKASLDEWQEQESSQAGWEKHVADDQDQRVVSTYGGPSPSKADRVAGMNKRASENPNAPKVGAAPALWIRTWDMGTAVVMIAVQPTYGERAYWSSRVLAPNKDGLWQMKESYHNYIAASGVMTEVQGE